MTTSQCEPRRLFIDIETYSDVDLPACGLYPYVESDAFEVLLVQYAWNDGPVRVIDLCTALHPISEEAEIRAVFDEMQDVVAGLLDPDTIKIAHNNAFERTCLGKHSGHYLPPEEWEDTSTMAAQNGLPLSLEAAGEALGIEQQKLREGKLLINYFCKPCKPTISNGQRTRNRPEHAPDKWERFKEYGKRDVEAMQEIYYRLQGLTQPAWERQVEALDARINESGVLVDIELAEAAVAVDDAFKAEHTTEMQRLTGLDNPNSVAQLKNWLAAVGLECESLSKEAVKDIKKKATDGTTKRVLELRQMLGKTSTAKYQAMTQAACKDNRIRGLLKYYGAGRTGRWAGRLVQVQNLPQNHLDDLDSPRDMVRRRDLESLELIYDSVPDVLSQLIRTAFIAKPGHTFLVADYAAIEARVIAYLAGEQWRQDVFKQGGDIYCSSASQMFKVPVEKHGINGHLRQKGKVAELACGYGGGVAALKAFGADKMGLTEAEMQSIVDQWRAASPTIPRFWRQAEQAAKRALERPGSRQTIPCCGVTYYRDKDALRCQLPSGRTLSYWGARLEGGKIAFMGQSMTKSGGQTKKWQKLDTWGGKLVENIVQAYARDCLAVSLLRLDAAGWRIVFHVHDEVVVEAPEGARWEDVAEVMGQPIDWAPGLLLRGDGYETPFYKKD